MSAIVVSPSGRYGGTVQFLSGMSIVWAKTTLDVENASTAIQREPFPEYGIISVLLFFRVVLRSAGGASATGIGGAGKARGVFPPGTSKIV
jgi:hypothetical protein